MIRCIFAGDNTSILRSLMLTENLLGNMVVRPLSAVFACWYAPQDANPDRFKTLAIFFTLICNNLLHCLTEKLNYEAKTQ